MNDLEHLDGPEQASGAGLGVHTDPLGGINRKQLIDSRGLGFAAFRKTLKPSFGRVWLELGLGHVGLVGTVIALVALPALCGPWSPLLVVPGGFLVGYFVYFINLFLHESAHYNLAAKRSVNDALTDAFIGVLVGQNVRRYRQIHFDHHRHLGTTLDTERAYFQRLTPRFLFEALFGIQALYVLMRREQHAKQRKTTNIVQWQVLAAVLLHGSLLGISIYSGNYVLAASWLVGLGSVFPFLTAVRQMLEHRSEAAQPHVDYAQHDHGPSNRIFKGFLSLAIGGAGFDRHMLHHWEPQISYTRLGALEDYLRDTSAAAALQTRTSSYRATLVKLLDEK